MFEAHQRQSGDETHEKKQRLQMRKHDNKLSAYDLEQSSKRKKDSRVKKQ